MDGFTLRCNNLRCRKHLEHRAIVTTCSHIFCSDCASSLHLSDPAVNNQLQRRCPACDTTLSAPDDAVLTVLNPSDDYKTSVLSGLNPTLIMEICGRGLGFWSYQVTQEVVYQEYLAKTLTEKYTALSTQLDKIIHDANTEIGSLRDKIATMTVSEEELRRKNHELLEGWREKGRKLAQTQELYDKLKRRTLISQVRHAASENVDQTILLSAQQHASSHHPQHLQNLNSQVPQHAIPKQRQRRYREQEPEYMMSGVRVGNVNGGGRSSAGSDTVSSGRASPHGRGGGFVAPVQPQQQVRGGVRGSCRGDNQNFAQNPFMGTTSNCQEHRQRLPTPAMNQRPGMFYQGNGIISGSDSGRRSPLAGLNGNVRNLRGSATAGIGMNIGSNGIMNGKGDGRNLRVY